MLAFVNIIGKHNQDLKDSIQSTFEDRWQDAEGDLVYQKYFLDIQVPMKKMCLLVIILPK